MYTTDLDSKILARVRSLSNGQKSVILDFLDELPKVSHSTRRYRQKGMKQIREALKNL